MSHPTHDHGATQRRPTAEELSAPATQIVRDRDAYLGQNREVGRRLTEDQVELFVTEDPWFALQREFARLEVPFITLHDVGTSTSLRLLQSMAATTGRVMRLSIRRQGQGVPLATIQFVEIAGSDGSSLRVYSTDIDADSHARHELARVLVAHAKLAVLVFGELPAHALASSLQPLVEAVGHGRWPGRQMLMIPLGGTAIASFATPFADSGIQVQVAPRVARATDAWSVIGSTWNRIDGITAENAAPAGTVPAGAPAAAPAAHPSTAAATPLAHARGEDAEAPTQPMGLAADKAGSHGGVNWFDYVQRCASVKGMISCCVFDRSDGRALAHAGGRPPAELMQLLGEQLLSAAGDAGAMLGTGPDVREASISYPQHHLMLRALPNHPGVVLHAVLDVATGNIAVARAQLQRLDPA